MKEQVLLILLIERDGRFSARDIWCLLKKQSILEYGMVILHQAGCKIPNSMAKMAVQVMEVAPSKMAGQINQLAKQRGEQAFLITRNYVQPTHNHWMKRMVEPVIKNGAVAVTGRQLPTPEANYFVAADVERSNPPKPEAPSRGCFSADNCCISRSALADKPFNENAMDAALVWALENSGSVQIHYADGGTVMRETLLPLPELFLNKKREAADRNLAGRRSPIINTVFAGLFGLLRDLWKCITMLRPLYFWYPFVYRFALWLAIMAGNGCSNPSSLEGGDDEPIKHDSRKPAGPSCEPDGGQSASFEAGGKNG